MNSSDDNIKEQYGTLRARATRIFMDIDQSVHRYMIEHDKAMETFRAFKIIDESTKEMLIELQSRIAERQKEISYDSR